MKVKFTEYNGALTVSVFGLGLQQELVICEDRGGFSFELRDRKQTHQANEPSQAEPRAVKATATVVEPKIVRDEKALDEKPLDEKPSDDGLFKKLVELRKELAVADSVPPYMVFHDKTLHEMVTKLPADIVAMSDVSGVGQAKLEKYGERFLAVINGAAA